MPQADTVLTVPLQGRPTGIFAEVSPCRGMMVDAAMTRLTGISALVFLVKNSEQVPQYIQNALCGIETAIDDVIGLLEVVPTGNAS